ncbi:MAG: hemerythrin domain-containing protein [Dehalococcoidia bacterium]|nr:hemerythrin domain-containing protein [Dehalococcoidia bacterium]
MATFGNLETTVEPLAGLMRDHEYVHALAEAAIEALQAAIAGGDAAEALERARDLDAFLVEELPGHIAIEEDVLFPALRGFTAEMDKVVVEMVEQHDEVRARAAAIEAALVALDAEHEEVEAAKAGVGAQLAAAQAGATPEALAGLLDAVKRLDWIFQGHFGDEEEDLFAPALELLPKERWEEMARGVKA